MVISQGDWHGITLSLSFRIITAFLTITVSYYRSSNLFVQTDVNTAITTTVAFYVIYYNKLYTPQWRSESYIWTGHDDQHRVQRTASIFLTSLLNGAECPMSHNGQSHNFFTIFPNKTDSKTLLHAENFSDRQTTRLPDKSESNVCYTSIYRSQPTSRSRHNNIFQSTTDELCTLDTKNAGH